MDVFDCLICMEERLTMENYKSEISRWLPIFAISIFFVMLFCLVLLLTGKVSLSFSGFAVDCKERLYIGMRNEIRVYENGQIVRTISPQTSRAYRFTIQEDQTILLSTSTKVYTMDLEGNVLSCKEDPGADTYNQISYRRRKFVSQKGDVYRSVGILGWTGIVKNGEQIVYQTDALTVCVKILFVLCWAAIFIFPIWGNARRQARAAEE